jgi:hypothetical protein
MNSDETRPPRKGGALTEKEQRRRSAATRRFGRYTIDENDQSVTHHEGA